MTLPAFATMFALLAVQLRFTDADEAVIRAYYEGLQDLESELLHAAAERLARTAGWFPKTSEWRAAVETIRHERLDAQRAYLRKAPQPLCGVCDDTGWAPIDVVEIGSSVRRVRPCGCRVQRHREIVQCLPPALHPESGGDEASGLSHNSRHLTCSANSAHLHIDRETSPPTTLCAGTTVDKVDVLHTRLCDDGMRAHGVTTRVEQSLSQAAGSQD